MVTQLRDNHQKILETGTKVVAIGMGRVDMAAHFRDEQDIPFPLLVDRTKESYRALEIKRGNWWTVAGPQVWPRAVFNMITGKGQSVPKQDPKQLGGLMIVDRGGEIRFIHRSGSSADNLPVDELIERL
ncbi:MAG TPA: peroxiredoxin-like family protein [Actinomycetota bacterium]|nr:peroxiredoxin-like family protein [Actinomycetota bacterium]